MADKYGDNAAFDWPDQWCDADDGVQDVAAPGAGDLAHLTANSGNATLTAGAATDYLVMTGFTGTLDLGAFTLDLAVDATLGDTSAHVNGTGQINVAGDLVLLSGLQLQSGVSFVMDSQGGATRTITSNSVAMGNLTIDDNGGGDTFQLIDNLDCDDFLLTDGVFQLNGQDMTCTLLDVDGGTLTGYAFSMVTVNGDIDYAAGTITDLHVTQAGTVVSPRSFPPPLPVSVRQCAV